MSSAIRAVLDAASRLTDAEQYSVSSWLNGGTRWYLYCLGLADEDVGKVYSAIGDHVEVRPTSEIDPRHELRQFLSALKSLSDNDFEAFRQWFSFGDREQLRGLGMSDTDIGPVRIVPDDIFPYEPEYVAAKDGTMDPGDSEGRKTALYLDGAWRHFY